ncbi:hypothetical protein [Streptomyces sp. NBC_00207]|uniref:hypothetical protein n=1 Tax=unclassified Streptomyces TaxID=2593676 RepID=UPI002888B2F2|nr:hypothetical protein [Streptomyces sp. DSM 41633]
MNRLRRTMTAALALAAVLAATGAEQGGCAPATDDKGRVTGDRGSACLFVPHIPFVEAGRLTGRVDQTCYEAVLESTVTVTLEKKTPGGWQEVAREQYAKAPALRVTKSRTVTTACVPGAYRTRYYATVQALKEPDGMADKGGAFTGPQVIGKEQCP